MSNIKYDNWIFEINLVDLRKNIIMVHNKGKREIKEFIVTVPAPYPGCKGQERCIKGFLK